MRYQEKKYGHVPFSELDSQRSGEAFVETFYGQLLALAGRKPSPALVGKFAAAYYDGLARSNCIYPKTREVLYMLRRNCKLAVVSNNPVEYVRPPLKANGYPLQRWIYGDGTPSSRSERPGRRPTPRRSTEDG